MAPSALSPTGLQEPKLKFQKVSVELQHSFIDSHVCPIHPHTGIKKISLAVTHYTQQQRTVIWVDVDVAWHDARP